LITVINLGYTTHTHTGRLENTLRHRLREKILKHRLREKILRHRLREKIFRQTDWEIRQTEILDI